MQITNFSFLFLFLPCALLLAFLTRKHLQGQNLALLVLSLAFYACSGIPGLLFVLGMSALVYLLARLPGRDWQAVHSAQTAPEKEPVGMLVPLLVLAALAVLLGLFPNPVISYVTDLAATLL